MVSTDSTTTTGTWSTAAIKHRADIFVLSTCSTAASTAEVLHQDQLKWGSVGLAWWALDFPLHAPARRGVPSQASGNARPRPGGNPARLRKVRPDTHQRDEFPRYALHFRPSIARQSRPTATCSKAEGRGIALALNAMGERFGQSSTSPSSIPTRADLLGVPLRPFAASSSRVQSLDVPHELMPGRLRHRSGGTRGLRALGPAVVARQDAQIDRLLAAG